MSLLHPTLLFGLLLAAIPVALHLMMRARPKKLIFPALRLLQQRRRQNQRRLRLRHLWLLLLRVAMVAALVLVLSRPSVPPANYTLNGWEIGSLAGIVALAAAAYAITMLLWQRQALPRHELLTRRTYLRGSTGVAAALLALLLVGWPYQRRIAAEIKSPIPNTTSDLPVAAVFLIDNSLSMGYQFEGQTRLAAARTIAMDQLQRLPGGSQATVFDAAGELPLVMSPDLTSVRNRLEALSLQSVVRDLNDQLLNAVRFHDDDRVRVLGEQANVPTEKRSDRFVREIYLFTDLAKSAWRQDASQTLLLSLKEREWLGVYLIDVGIEQPTNLGITDVRLSRQTVGAGGQVTIDATVRSDRTEPQEAVVEFWQSIDEGAPVKRDQSTVQVAADGAARVSFTADQLTGRVVQGELKLVASDPLPFDDAARFTLQILPPLNVLVVTPRRQIAAFWLEALEGLATVGSAYRSKLILNEQLASTNLAEYDVVCLLNVPRCSDEEWQQLADFARDGGGVLVCLGATSQLAAGTIDPVSYQTDAAAQLLPVRPRASLSFSTPQQLNFRGSPHPLTQRLETMGALTALGEVDFRRYWTAEPVPDAVTLARWTDDQALPAVVLRDVGKGRCLAFLSSVDSTAWSDWPRNWTFLAVADQWLQLLSRQAASRHTFLVGDPIVLPVEMSSGQPSGVLLRQPDLTQRRLEIAAATKDISIPDARLLGNYQLVTASASPQLLTGFSLNVPTAESDLTRLKKEELDAMLGEQRYGLARDLDQLEKSVLTGRFGQEISGLLLALMILVFLLEQATSTWFYQQDDPTTVPAAA